jgi:hypothetical protein
MPMANTSAAAGRHVVKIGDWRCLEGEVVELCRNGALIRTGTVDAVMFDGSGLWLAAKGADPRVYVDKNDGIEIWAEWKQVADEGHTGAPMGLLQ